MDGVANLADVMLVFACGLLVALILNWNVDVNNPASAVSPDKYEIDDISQSDSEVLGVGSELQEMGKVYKDTKTGKYYVFGEPQ